MFESYEKDEYIIQHLEKSNTPSFVYLHVEYESKAVGKNPRSQSVYIARSSVIDEQL